MQTYILDLITLLHILTRQRQNGVLQADEVQLPGFKQPVQARLVLVQGKVDSCLIFLTSTSDILAEGSQALRLLQEAGTFEWSWTVQPPSTMRVTTSQRLPAIGNAQALQNSEALPRRTRAIETAVLENLPRTHRRILALVDGTRTIGKIASMLALTDPGEFRTALRELQGWGMITLD